MDEEKVIDVVFYIYDDYNFEQLDSELRDVSPSLVGVTIRGKSKEAVGDTEQMLVECHLHFIEKSFSEQEKLKCLEVITKHEPKTLVLNGSQDSLDLVQLRQKFEKLRLMQEEMNSWITKLERGS